MPLSGNLVLWEVKGSDNDFRNPCSVRMLFFRVSDYLMGDMGSTFAEKEVKSTKVWIYRSNFVWGILLFSF